MAYNLKINGKAQTVDVPAEMPMLWVLRDTLNMKGTKFGCGIGACGACTIHVDGVAVRGCSTTVSSIGTKAVTTIEGMADDKTGVGPKLQTAWQTVDVPQCGYCQAGQIMSAAALLSKTPKPTDAQINTAMTGNICRCGTYLRIREAIKLAANGAAK